MIEHNALLIREVESLRYHLTQEQLKVQDLYEDAQHVRDELLRELTKFEKAK